LLCISFALFKCFFHKPKNLIDETFKNTLPYYQRMPEDTPTEAVLSMRQQGLTNNQVIATLQRQGYNTNQILDAMNQADIRMQTKRPFDTEGGKMPENIPGQPLAERCHMRAAKRNVPISWRISTAL
jgi:hypothetical protein